MAMLEAEGWKQVRQKGSHRQPGVRLGQTVGVGGKKAAKNVYHAQVLGLCARLGKCRKAG